MTIDRPVMASVFNPLIIIAGTHQAVDVNSRNALQGKHNRMGADKPLQRPLIRPRLSSLQCIKQRDINFIGFAFALVYGTPGDTPAKLLHGFHQRIYFAVVE